MDDKIKKRKALRHVFISYVHENSKLIHKLARKLENSGITVWTDITKLRAGEPWEEAIEKAIQEGMYFIACFSKSYQDKIKNYINEELRIAIQQLRRMHDDRIWFIPVKLTDCEIPEIRIDAARKITRYQWVDLYIDWDDGVKR